MSGSLGTKVRSKDQIMAGSVRYGPASDIGPDSLFLSFYASAEVTCHLALGWPIPINIVDLFAEFRNLTNGLTLPAGRSLIGALTYFGLQNIGALKKEVTRDLVLTGGPWSHDQQIEILDYCESDVDALARLAERMFFYIDPRYARLRGRYMAAVAQMEHNGIPIDIECFNQFQNHWESIKLAFIRKLANDYGIYVRHHF